MTKKNKNVVSQLEINEVLEQINSVLAKNGFEITAHVVYEPAKWWFPRWFAGKLGLRAIARLVKVD